MDDLNPTGVHTGGTMNFGPDGKLYVSIGDDARGNVVSQSLTSDLGKILRLNADGSIPTDNPFYNQTTGKYRSIWAYGLRNPYTWSFDATGQMLIDEVGLSTWEEINEGQAGGNYGWPAVEGVGNDPALHRPDLRVPARLRAERGLRQHRRRVRRPRRDATSRRRTTASSSSPTSATAGSTRSTPMTHAVADFAQGISRPPTCASARTARCTTSPARREPPATRHGCCKIAYTGDPSPSIDQQPADVTVGVGESATFSASANGTGPLSYQWLRDGAPDRRGATQPQLHARERRRDRRRCPVPVQGDQRVRHGRRATRRRSTSSRTRRRRSPSPTRRSRRPTPGAR